MVAMNIFQDDAFGLIEMTEAVNKVEFQPNYLGSLNLFTPTPIRTVSFFMEEKDGALSLIQTTERGAPIVEDKRDRRRMRAFGTARIAKGTTIHADEIQGVRAFGSETEFSTAQSLVAEKMTGDTGLLSQVEFTFEAMRLGAIKGQVLDADGSTLIDWHSEFGIAPNSSQNWALSTGSTEVRKKCSAIIRAMARASKGAMGPGSSIHALCGDDFYDALTNHPEVRETYLNQQAANALRDAVVDSGASGVFGRFSYGGITFHNYRGTDDGTRVAVGAKTAHFFPMGARGVFRQIMAPGESFEFVNTPGRRLYAMTISDRDRNSWVRPEVYSYPLFTCLRPDLLNTATTP